MDPTLDIVAEPAAEILTDVLAGGALPVDFSDPFVIVLAWGLTALLAILVSRYPRLEGLRHALPGVAVLVALLVRTVMAFVGDEPLTALLAFRAVAAGCFAVVMHSQYREVLKAFVGVALEKDDEPTDETGDVLVLPKRDGDG